jgi:hypothetical protein
MDSAERWTLAWLLLINKRSETKFCEEFDDNAPSLGVYICYGCIKNEREKNIFLIEYYKPIEAIIN